jgi:peptide deformylase
LIANPKIVGESIVNSYLKSGEGCLSVEQDHPGVVKRKSKIIVKALNLLDNNREVVIEAEGILSICLQHEIDHLYGILYYDHIKKDDPFFAEED